MPPADYAVRPATPADHAALTAFNLAHAAEVEGLTLDPLTVAAGVHAVLHDRSKGFYLVAADAAGQAAGSLLVTYEWSDWRNRWVWWIQSVYVQPAHRRQGVWQALHAEVVRQAQAAGVGLVRLYVYAGNAAAQQAYARSGMAGGHYVVYEQPVPDAL